MSKKIKKIITNHEADYLSNYFPKKLIESSFKIYTKKELRERIKEFLDKFVPLKVISARLDMTLNQVYIYKSEIEGKKQIQSSVVRHISDIKPTATKEEVLSYIKIVRDRAKVKSKPFCSRDDLICMILEKKKIAISEATLRKMLVGYGIDWMKIRETRE